MGLGSGSPNQLVLERPCTSALWQTDQKICIFLKRLFDFHFKPIFLPFHDFQQIHFKNPRLGSWRDDSEIKSICCPCRRFPVQFL